MEEGLALCAYIITREYQLNINRIYVLIYSQKLTMKTFKQRKPEI